jgi:hypothetical protein
MKPYQALKHWSKLPNLAHFVVGKANVLVNVLDVRLLVHLPFRLELHSDCESLLTR